MRGYNVIGSEKVLAVSMRKEMGMAELGSVAGPIGAQPDFSICLVMCLEYGVLQLTIWCCRSEGPFGKVGFEALTATIYIHRRRYEPPP
jgi:hypothetical protein